jgi:hypothetical protein
LNAAVSAIYFSPVNVETAPPPVYMTDGNNMSHYLVDPDYRYFPRLNRFDGWPGTNVPRGSLTAYPNGTLDDTISIFSKSVMYSNLGGNMPAYTVPEVQVYSIGYVTTTNGLGTFQQTLQELLSPNGYATNALIAATAGELSWYWPAPTKANGLFKYDASTNHITVTSSSTSYGGSSGYNFTDSSSKASTTNSTTFGPRRLILNAIRGVLSSTRTFPPSNRAIYVVALRVSSTYSLTNPVHSSTQRITVDGNWTFGEHFCSYSNYFNYTHTNGIRYTLKYLVVGTDSPLCRIEGIPGSTYSGVSIMANAQTSQALGGAINQIINLVLDPKISTGLHQQIGTTRRGLGDLCAFRYYIGGNEKNGTSGNSRDFSTSRNGFGNFYSKTNGQRYLIPQYYIAPILRLNSVGFYGNTSGSCSTKCFNCANNLRLPF